MNIPRMLRKRFIPEEVLDISGDRILYRDEELIVTQWEPIHTRKDVAGGISFAYLKKGYKISRFYGPENKFLYWYCDIIETEYDESTDTYTFIDLLLDIKILPDGKVILLDADELADAFEEGLITQKQLCNSLRTMNSLLDMINRGIFPPEQCKNYSKYIQEMTK